MSKSQDIMHVYYDTFARSFSFIWGILLAILHYKYNFKIAKPLHQFKKVLFAIYSIALILLSVFVSADSNEFAFFMILATFVSIRLIEYATMEGQTNKKTNKLVKYLSNCSYEIYLVQYPIIYITQSSLINSSFKTLIIISLTLIISIIINNILNKKYKNNILDILKTIVISSVIVWGEITLITEKDHSQEMNELENKLNENQQLIEQKNSEYLATSSQDNEELKKKLESIQNQEEYTAELVKNLPVVGVGDSVLLGAIDELYEQFPNGYFNGKVSRTIKQGKELLLDLKSQGKLGNTLILVLANNGDYSTRVNKDFIESLEGREIYWVDAVGADDPEFNERFREFAKDYPNIHIVEWEKASKGHPEYFYADGIHTKGDGLKAYVNTIYQAIYENYLKENLKNKKTEETKIFSIKANEILINLVYKNFKE